MFGVEVSPLVAQTDLTHDLEGVDILREDTLNVI